MDSLILLVLALAGGALVGVAVFQLSKGLVHPAISALAAAIVAVVGSIIGISELLSSQHANSPMPSDAGNYVWMGLVLVVVPVAALSAAIFGAGFAQSPPQDSPDDGNVDDHIRL